MSVEEFLESENLDDNTLYSGHPTDKWYYGEGDINYPPTQSDGMGFKPNNECKEQNIVDFSG